MAVDWSGAWSAAQQRRHIVWAEVRRGRLTAVEDGCTREEVLHRMLALADEDPNVVVGLDFSFSFPAWFCESLGATDVEDLWALVEAHGEQWLSDCPPPFWGRRGTRKPPAGDLLRRCEAEVGRVGGVGPKSTFQVGGAGSVGTGAVRGMPLLRRLRAAGWGIWPFDAATAPFVVELYPRLFTPGVRKTRRAERAAFLAELDVPASLRATAEDGDDAFDAALSALAMYRHREHLASLERTSCPRELLEGAIWVPEGERPWSGGETAALS